jgi:hypothetical protein
MDKRGLIFIAVALLHASMAGGRVPVSQDVPGAEAGLP